jgi:hypothetical protein
MKEINAYRRRGHTTIALSESPEHPFPYTIEVGDPVVTRRVFPTYTKAMEAFHALVKSSKIDRKKSHGEH